TFCTSRAVRTSDGRRVVLKAPADPTQAERETTRLRREFEMSRAVSNGGIVRALALEPCGAGAILVLEDVGGISLQQLLNGVPMPLLDFCTIAIQLADTVVSVHGAGVLHGDIQPANVLVVPGTLETRLAGFGSASYLNENLIRSRNRDVG